MKRIALSVMLGVCTVFSATAQQDLKKSVCVVRQNTTDSDLESYEKTASTLFSNSYMSAARQLRKGMGGFGSGFLYKSEDGKYYVITNKHVVEDAKTVRLVFKEESGDNTIPNCKVVTKSDSTDIAIIEFPSSEASRYIPLTFHTGTVSDGTNVWSAGYPGLGDSPSWQLGNGVVSNGKFNNMELTDGAHIDIIQHTAQVDPGSSGGPLLILNETTHTTSKEVMEGKKKKTVTETVVEKEYKVVGMNTWKAFRRENANFSLMVKDIKNVVDNINKVSVASTKSDNNEKLQKQVEKFLETFSKSSSEMAPFISNKMATSMSETQLTSMIENISTDASSSLRDGNAVDGLKKMIADNIKAPIKKPANLKVSNVEVEDDLGIATFSYGKKQYKTNWVKNYDGWQLSSTDLIGEKAAKGKTSNDVEGGFRVLDLDGFGRVELSFFAPIGKEQVFTDEYWGNTSVYNDKFKFGLDYSHFFSRFVNWTTAFDYGKMDRHISTTSTYDKWNSEIDDYYEYTEVEELNTELKYLTLVTGVGVQCPMAVNRVYFGPDFRAQFGYRLGIGDFLEDSDNGMGFIAVVEASLNVGYMFSEDKILYGGFGINRKKILGDLSDTTLDKLKYFVIKIGYLFD